MSTNIHPRLCDAPTAPCDSAGHRKGSSQNTAVAAASDKSWAAAQFSPCTDWCYHLNDPARAQANVQAHAETGERRKPISPHVNPNPVSDTTRLADSRTESGFLFLGSCRAVSLKGYMYQVICMRVRGSRNPRTQKKQAGP